MNNGFSSRGEIIAMWLGVVTMIVAFAWTAALVPIEIVSSPLGAAWRAAANLRTGVAFVVGMGLSVDVTPKLAFMLFTELWTGMLAAQIAHVLGGPDIARAGSGELFGWTYFTTVLHGTCVAATMLVLGLLLWPVVVGWRRIAPKN